MKFYKNLYIGDTVKNPRKIKRKLKKYAKLTNIYVIAYMEQLERLEICHCIMLKQYYYRENPPYIIGIARSKQEAFEMILKIAQESIEKTGAVDLTAYLFSQESGPSKKI